MKKISLARFTFFLCLCIVGTLQTAAQKATAPNGHFVTAKGLKLYYEETGKGMPLLLLHGFMRTASDWSYGYGSYTAALSKNYRVIAMDLPGHGRSDCMDTTDIYLHKRAAEYILAALDSLHIDSINVIGSSSGAFITLYLATMRSSFIKKMVVIGGQVYYSNATRHQIIEIGESIKNTARMEELIQIHGKQKANLLSRQFLNFSKLYGDPSFTPDVLSTIKAKTFIIHGDNDMLAPVSNAWEMYQNIPGAHLWIVPNGGHIPQIIPDYQQEFIRLVSTFLTDSWGNVFR